MKKTKKLLSFCIPALCLLCAGNLYASGREVLFNNSSFRSLTPKTFRGRAIAIIQPTGEKGDIRLTVSSEGLREVVLNILNTDYRSISAYPGFCLRLGFAPKVFLCKGKISV